MKLVFIDSNIFLNFYDFHDEDLEQLNKLADLVDVGEIKLYLTTQVINEVKKNRDLRLSDSYKKFSAHKPELPMPVFCKSYEEYVDIKKVQKILNKLKSRLSKKISFDIQSKQLKADIIIELLIEKSEVIQSDEYLEKAVQRHRLGRPPGKKDRSYGDEINWESILVKVSEEGDFIIVSQDSDYSSAVDKYELKDYLVEEWSQKKSNNIYFYRSLTSFFTKHDIKIELRIEKEKDGLIEDLTNSCNFLATHGIINKLNEYANFTDEQLKGLAFALLGNQQVNWVVTDVDVNRFYRNCFSDKSDKFEPEIWNHIRSFIWQEGSNQNLKEEINEIEDKVKKKEGEIDPDEIPF